MQFGSVVAQKQFSRFERLIPQGFPLTPFQVVYRYRKADAPHGTPLYQLGNGIFTANATPPYESWMHFFPVVQEGVNALFQSFDNLGELKPTFNFASVRYIDGFKSNLTRGRPLREFLSDALGVRLELPAVLDQISTDASKLQPTLQLSMPVTPGQLNLVLAPGTVENEEAVIMDTTVIVNRAIQPQIADVMDTLTDAQKISHQIFEGVTEKLRDQMEPIEV
jgi:uncharacterized protein (TIGR04255 family)